MNIKHIFFDLDRTLWDFEKNSYKTLLQLIDEFELIKRGVDTPEDFINKYKIHNEKLWVLYREGKITKENLRVKRFFMVLDEYGISDIDLADSFGKEYIRQSPLKTELIPFSIKILKYLSDKYQLHIITNGFNEVQFIKLDSSGLKEYFDVIVTSEQVGVNKPDARIFNYALNQAKAKAEESIMIGDNLSIDILGARKVGMHSVYFNPNMKKHNKEIVHEISCLSELMNLL